MSLSIFPQEWLDAAVHAWMALCGFGAGCCVLKAAWSWAAKMGQPWRPALSACWLVALGSAGPWMFGAVGAASQFLIDQAWRHSVEARVETRASWEAALAAAPDPQDTAWGAAARTLPGDGEATAGSAAGLLLIGLGTWAWARRRLSRIRAAANDDPWRPSRARGP